MCINYLSINYLWTYLLNEINFIKLNQDLSILNQLPNNHLYNHI